MNAGIEDSVGSTLRRPVAGQVDFRSLIDFCALMHSLLQVGTPLQQALEYTRGELHCPKFQRAIGQLRRLMEGGESLPDALARHPDVFPIDAITFLRAAATSGSVPEAFLKLKHHFQAQAGFRAQLRRISLHLLVLLIAAAGFLSALTNSILARAGSSAAATNGVPLHPTLTKIHLNPTVWVWLVGVAVVATVLQLDTLRFPRIAAWLERAPMAVPFVRTLGRSLLISRLFHNLAFLSRSGIPLATALQASREREDSPFLKTAIDEVLRRVQAGEPLADALRQHNVFPVWVAGLVETGERSDFLDQSFEGVTAYYEVALPPRTQKLLITLRWLAVSLGILSVGALVFTPR